MGLVERAAVTDGSRAVWVRLTDKGHRTVEQIVDTVLTDEVNVISGLPRSKQAALAELLRELLRVTEE